MTEQLNNEVDYVERALGDFFQRHGMVRTSAEPTLIAYDGDAIGLDIAYDARFGNMVFGGMFLRVPASGGRYPVRDLLQFLHPQRHSYEQMKEDHDLPLPGLKTHLYFLEKYLDPFLEKSDFSWEKGLSQHLKQKYPWAK